MAARKPLSARESLEVAQEHLTNEGWFIPLMRGTKKPLRSFGTPEEKKSLKRSFVIPKNLETHGFHRGFIPSEASRLVILDLDVPRKKGSPALEPREQLELLRREFGIPRSTLTVSTPSGGLHVYLRWPSSEELPFQGKLSSLDERLQGDLRSGRSNGYVLVPGAGFGDQTYRVLNACAPRGISIKAARHFLKNYKTSKRYAVQGEAPAPRSTEGASQHSPAPSATPTAEGTPSSVSPLTSSGLSQAYLGRLRQVVEAGDALFHRRRAKVYRLLSCCDAEETIVWLWQTLMLDRDTATGSTISLKQLQADVKRLQRNFGPSREHSNFCATARARQRFEGSTREDLTTLEPQERERRRQELLEQRNSRLRSPNNWRTPRVVAFEGIHRVLFEEGRVSKHAPLAFAILEDIVSPWLNHGVANVLLGNDFLQGFYGVPLNDIRQAKRLMLKKGILHVSVKQAQGRTTSFALHKSYEDAVGSRALQAFTFKHQGPLVLDTRTQFVYDPSTGKVLGSIGTRLRAMKRLTHKLPPVWHDLTLHTVLTGELEETPRGGHYLSREDNLRQVEERLVLRELGRELTSTEEFFQDWQAEAAMDEFFREEEGGREPLAPPLETVALGAEVGYPGGSPEHAAPEVRATSTVTMAPEKTANEEVLEDFEDLSWEEREGIFWDLVPFPEASPRYEEYLRHEEQRRRRMALKRAAKAHGGASLTKVLQHAREHPAMPVGVEHWRHERGISRKTLRELATAAPCRAP